MRPRARATASRPPRTRPRGQGQRGHEGEPPDERVRAIEGEEPERGTREGPVTPRPARSARDTREEAERHQERVERRLEEDRLVEDDRPRDGQERGRHERRRPAEPGARRRVEEPHRERAEDDLQDLGGDERPAEGERHSEEVDVERCDEEGLAARWSRAGGRRPPPPDGRDPRRRRCRAGRPAAAGGARGAATPSRRGRRAPGSEGEQSSPRPAGCAAAGAVGVERRPDAFRASLANPGPPPDGPERGRYLARRGAGVAEQGRLLICCRGLKPLPGVRIPPSPPTARLGRPSNAQPPGTLPGNVSLARERTLYVLLILYLSGLRAPI